jgi:hypothetical protein
MDLIHNERIKLLATFLNGIAVAVFAVGGLAPLFSSLYGTTEFRPYVAPNSTVCIFTAFGLHYVGSLALRKLRP